MKRSIKRIGALLFDLDGTLLDSAPDLVGSLNWVRQSEGLQELDLDEMKRYASKGAIGLLRAGMPEADEAVLETWRQRFLEHYAANSYRRSSLFEGVPELLAYLAEAGVPWGVVTNKIETLTRPILEAARIADAASCVVCGDTLSQSKPHPAPVELACRLVGVRPAEALMVGDDVRDIQAGRAAGALTAAVYYGYGSDELTGDAVDGSYPVHHPSDLEKLIERAESG
jgi:phosphoglycolate phosphatase